jgi:UDP-N-acetylglucosamine 2-epimerase
MLPHVHLFKNLPPEDFIRVLHGGRCIVGNSSVAIRECSYMGIPAVNIGTRQSGRDRAHNVVDVPYDREAINAALQTQYAVGRLEPDHMYGNGGAGQAIADLLARVALTIEKRLTY